MNIFGLAGRGLLGHYFPTFAKDVSHLLVRFRIQTFPSLRLRHNSFSNPSVALPTSQLILQPFRCFTYVTVHSLALLSLLLRHKLLFNSLNNELCSFSNLSVTSPTSQLILQSFRRFTTSQLKLQPFRRFTYVTVHSPTLLSLLLRHKLFT